MDETRFPALLARAQQQVPLAVDELMSWCAAYLKVKARHYAPLAEADQDDFTQATLVRVLVALPTVQAQTLGQFKGWLCELLRNQYLERLRRHKPTLPLDDLSWFPATEETPSTLLSGREQQERLEAAVRQLDDDHRRAWGLHVAGQSNAEIAVTLGVHPSTISRWITQCETTLGKHLATQ